MTQDKNKMAAGREFWGFIMVIPDAPTRNFYKIGRKSLKRLARKHEECNTHSYMQ